MTERLKTDARGEQIASMQAMLEWLRERPELPVPLKGTWAMPSARWGEDGDVFHVFTRSEQDVERLARQFDEVEGSMHRDYPVGVRRIFGSIGYEVLLANPESGWWPQPEPRDAVQRLGWLDGMLEMTTWLGDRPELRLPLVGPRVLRSEGLDLEFGSWAPRRESRRLAEAFDRIDRPAYLPSYVEPVRRAFSGGVSYALRCEPMRVGSH